MSHIRRFLLVSALLALNQTFYAQDKLVRFGKPDESELKMTDCDFDPGADKICLLEEGEVMYNLNSSTPVLETEIRKRFKILKTSAISDADIKLSYYSKDNYENIAGIDGYVYNKDDQGNTVTTRLSKGDIYRKKTDEQYSEVSFALPNVKVGSVFEYRYKIYRYTISNIRPWYFQHTYPTVYSAYHLMIPEYFDFTYQAVRRQDLSVTADKTSAKGAWYSMHKIPALHEEPYMAGSNDFLQRVEFHLTTINPPGESPIIVGKTWDEIGKDLMSNPYFGQQIHKNIHGTEALKAVLDTCKSKIQKLKAIYQYVQQNMAWDNNYSLFCADNGIKDAWDKKQGSTADINMMLVDLLLDNDIEARPILVSTRDNGSVNTRYPDIQQFNATMAYAKIDTTEYFLNAADQQNPVGLVPYEIQYTNALIVGNKDTRWVAVFDNTEKERTAITVSLNLQKKGELNGFGMFSYYDYARNQKMDEYQKKNLKEILSIHNDINLKVDSFTVSNADNHNKPLEININYTGDAQKSGNYFLLPYDLFLGFKKNPFTEEKRVTDINFGFLQDFKINGYIALDSGFVVESMPKSMSIRLADNSILFKRVFQKSGNSVAFQLTIQYMRPLYNPQEYPDIRAYYKKMYELLAEKIVVKRI